MSDEIILVHAGLATPRGKKPSVQYRTSPYTVEQYCALPYTQRRAVDAECDARAGLAYTTYDDETSEKPYTVGRRTTSTTSPPASPMSAYVHPKPSPALHFLNTPELIEHDETHPDNEHTSAAPVGEPTAGLALRYDLATVVSYYLTLTPTEGDTDWTHWGPSPFVKGDTHSFAVNTDSGIYRCCTSHQTGKVLDFVMFMEECDQFEGLAWLIANFPSEPTSPGVVHETAQLPTPEPVAEIGTVTDGPACAYPDRSPASFEAMAQATAAAAAPTQPAAPVAVEGTIYSTTNYELFHLLPQNRVIDQGQVRKLVTKITQKNLLHIKPLDVTADMGIIDGQHRWAAARELGVPIYYKVGQQLSEDDIAILNETSKNWAGTDYLHLWTVQGKPDYQALTDFLARHPRISFSNAKMMLGGSTNNRVEEFRAGRWKVDDTYRAERVAEMVERIAVDVKNFKQPNHTGFVAALYHCVSNVGGFDSNEMLRTILKQPMSLVPCASHKQWLEMLSKIYNWHKNAANQIRFE